MSDLQRFRAVKSLNKHLDKFRRLKMPIGFVPTMGALHDGHIALLRQSAEYANITVCSIFVNPTQFDDPVDLRKYPRNLAKDRRKLQDSPCQILFTPNAKEIYPPDRNHSIEFDLGGLDRILEGVYRPGHFAGVAQVVKRLLDIVKPDYLVMGQKDFQQAVIIRQMICYLGIPCQLMVCATIRESNGLAMSSRNERLNQNLRHKASIIYQTLRQTKLKFPHINPYRLEEDGMEALKISGFRPEYYRIIDGHSLQPVSNPLLHQFVVAVTAVWAGNVRLIDNMILKGDF